MYETPISNWSPLQITQSMIIGAGMLEYYLLEDNRSGKCRGSNHMGKATVIPSPDDENTFTINFVSGDHYKVRLNYIYIVYKNLARYLYFSIFVLLAQVRASSARERQVWVDRLRHCIYQHSRTEEDKPVGERSLPLTSIDAFGSVRDELEKVHERQEAVSQYIESLPVPRPDDSLSPSCHNPSLLVVKATSQAVVSCLQTATETLQQLAEQQICNSL